MKLLYQTWNRNDATDWLLALSVLVLALLGLALARSIARRVLPPFATKAGAGLDSVLLHVIDGTKLWLLFPAALYAATLVLDAPPKVRKIMGVFAVVALTLQGAVLLNRFIAAWVRRQIGMRSADGETVTALSMISFVAQILVWILASMLVLDQLSFDITALVAGLGIGGIAVALAVQNILGDLLASLSIVLDKPFVVGDSIMVGECRGTVEHIGIKTTRVRSLNGEVIVFSNNDLLKSRIHNFKRMHERRVSFTLEVVYQTTPEQLQRIPAVVREAVELQKKTRFERTHLKECGAHGYIFEAVYMVTDRDIDTYMDIHQQVNLEIIRAFQRNGIEFAYPTQTLFIQTQKLDDARLAAPERPMRRLSAG